jgi:hypothetical protein
MKIYFAGTTALKKREDLVLGVVKNRLLSFYYVQQYEAGGDMEQKYSFDRIIEMKKGEEK